MASLWITEFSSLSARFAIAGMVYRLELFRSKTPTRSRVPLVVKLRLCVEPFRGITDV
jgi:hypothetical protein